MLTVPTQRTTNRNGSMVKTSLFLIGNLLLVGLLVGTSTHTAWAVVLLLWLNLLFYCLSRIDQRAFFAAFLVAFFIFLMGRITLMEVFGYREVAIEPHAMAHLCTVLLLGLGSIGLTFVIGDWFRRPAQKHGLLSSVATFQSSVPRRLLPSASTVQYSASVAFWVTLPLAIYQDIDRLRFVAQSGYANLYSQEYRSSEASGFGAILSQFDLMNSAAFLVILATMPALRNARVVVSVWVLSLLLSLGAGQRAEFIAGILVLVCYAVLRNRLTPEEPWINRRSALALVIMAPLLIVSLIAVETIRGVGSGFSGGNPVVDFVYNQGVSANAIINGYKFHHVIPTQGYLLEFLHSGVMSRVLGLEVYPGNSIDRAFEGASYTHTLSYFVLGEDLYLSGRGTGSSFLAEAYQDLGYFGVVFVGIVYGVLLVFISGLRQQAVVVNSLRLVIVMDVFLAPRFSASSFVSTALAPGTLAVIAVIVLFALAIQAYIPKGILGSPDRPGRSARQAGRI